jgi:signal recognition particle GTPase
MNYKKYSLLAIACFLSLNIHAAENNTAAQMTDENRQKISQASYEHMNCMNEYAITQLETQPDIRVIADHAMKECAPILEDLHNVLVESNFAPEASSRFVSSISNKSANKLLSKLMMFMAGRNSQ